MTRISNRPQFSTRTLASVVFLTLVGVVQADLKMNVVVNASVENVRGLPKSGQYEVDFKGALARVVEPSGTIKIFDLASSQVATLDATTKTYFVESLSSGTSKLGSQNTSATVSLDRTASSQTMFGATAQKITISPQSSGHGQSGTGTAAGGGLSQRRGLGISGPLPSSQGSSGFQAGQSGGNSQVSFTGSGWVADGSSVKSSLKSVAPLVSIGAPHALVQSITQTFDQQGVIPVSLSFGWSNGSSGTGALAMTVGSIDGSTLAASLFAIPTGYTQVQKPISK